MKGETLVSLTALNAANQRAQDAETQCDILERERQLLQSKVGELTEELQNQREGAPWLEHPDWMAIRARFFTECVDRKTEYYPEFGDVRKVSLAPHDLFEWFKSQLTKNIKPVNKS